MKKKVLLAGILGFTLILRIWRIGIVPPLGNNTPVILRSVSAFLSVGSSYLLYRYLLLRTSNKKLGLLAAWVLGVFPWVIDQGRIVSQVNIGLFFFLLMLLMARKISRARYKLLLFLIFIVCLFFVYPDFWIFRTLQIVPVNKLSTNIFSLTSFEFLFFHNTSFWWGSLRDWGIMHLTFLPPLVIGLYETVRKKDVTVLLWLAVLTFIAAASPYLPESREFYLAVPFLTYLVTLGIYRIGKINGRTGIILQLAFILLTMYDISLYLHLYFVHFPIQVMEGLTKINGLY